MKKLIALAMLAISAVAVAGTSSQTSAADGDIQSGIDFNKYPRVLTFVSHRNASPADGTLLVCPHTAESNWRDNTCTVSGKNAWVAAENVLPGWTLKRYEFRFTGSDGYRHLILYFSKK